MHVRGYPQIWHIRWCCWLAIKLATDSPRQALSSPRVAAGGSCCPAAFPRCKMVLLYKQSCRRRTYRLGEKRDFSFSGGLYLQHMPSCHTKRVQQPAEPRRLSVRSKRQFAPRENRKQTNVNSPPPETRTGIRKEISKSQSTVCCIVSRSA